MNGNGTNATSTETEVILGATDGASIEVLSGVTLGQKLMLQNLTTSGATTTTRSSSSTF
jgi:hypothetical protein